MIRQGRREMSRLIDVEAKIERAKHHVNDLDTRVAIFLDECSGPLPSDLNSDGDKVYRINQLPEVPADWPDIVGDAANNLRSALNYLICTLVVANQKSVGRGTQFPISETATKYGSAETQRMVEGISSPAKTVLDSIKPYQGGDNGLWSLSVVNNQDKHRLRLGVFPLWNRLRISKPTGTGFFTHVVLDRNTPLVSGTEVGRIKSPHGATENADVELSFDVAFVEPEVVKGQSVVPLLRELCRLVTEVVDKFRPLL